MMLSSTLDGRPEWASPPGDTIVSILDERELTIEKFAEQVGLSQTRAQQLIDGTRSIDRDLARRLAHALGATEKFWIAREHDYRAAVSPPENVRVSTIAQLLAKLPIKDMQNFGWIPPTGSDEARIVGALEFFGVSTFAQWQGRYENAFHEAAYRRSTAHKNCEIATTAWLRQGEIETEHDVVGAWDPDLLAGQIDQLRRLTWIKNPEIFVSKVKKLLAKAGVKFAIVRAPKGCTASGAVRILPDDTPHIQVSFRFLADDQFWFSLFHEIGHLVLHFHRMPILEDDGDQESDIEREANDYAANLIVPTHLQEELYSLPALRFPIIAFAKKAGVAPGLIVGRLQHDGLLRHSQMQHLKRRFVWRNHPRK
jgi:plasmid maintenance system antidote protein VapI